LVGGNDTVKVKLNQFNQWQSKSFKTMEVDEVFISLQDIQGDIPITELEFYYEESIKITPPKQYTGDALKLGTNGFHWHPTDLIPVPNIRVYQMTQWTWTPKGLAVNPTVQADGMYDEYFTELKSKSIVPIPCINKVPNWSHQSATDSEWPDLKFNERGTDPTNPLNYKSIAEYGFQLAARYGKVKHPTEVLKVNGDQRWNGDIVNLALSGLDLLQYIELENEPDRPWKNPTHKYTPQEYAAFCSAVYDGHEGRMGKGYGIKNADPNMKVVMAGLSAINLDYIKAMDVWFKANRTDKKFACDVVNFHHYCNASNQFPGYEVNLWQGYGIDPLEDNLDFRLEMARKTVDKNIPVWFTEFGYDTNPCSTPLCQYLPDSLQGEYLIKTFLIAISKGIEKSFIYNLGDEPSASMGYVFGSSGLLHNGEWKPKPAYQQIKDFANELDGYTFVRVESHGTVYVFENSDYLKCFIVGKNQPVKKTVIKKKRRGKGGKVSQSFKF
jgi:hypothetical protein